MYRELAEPRPHHVYWAYITYCVTGLNITKVPQVLQKIYFRPNYITIYGMRGLLGYGKVLTLL